MKNVTVYVYKHTNKINGKSYIGQAANGKRKTAGGFVWEFLSKE